MRQGQQNRRGRNRSGGRKPQSALSRNFESNGPNVKIRGTAAHIAEKYVTLARDAQSSGDIIAAESYLQHAEHYNRIIAAAQAERQNGADRPGQASGNGRDHHEDPDQDSEDEEAAQSRDRDTQTADAAGSSTNAEQNKRRRRKPANGDEAGASKGGSGNGNGQRQAHSAQSRRSRTKAPNANGASAAGDQAAPDSFSG
jgi:hypothetical protein